MKAYKVKQPNWTEANSRSALKSCGFGGTHRYIKKAQAENEIIRRALIKRDYVFVDSVRIADFISDFDGYTLTFRKLVAGKYFIFFSWRWHDHGSSTFWEASMRSSHRAFLDRAETVSQPFMCYEIDYIRSNDLDRIDDFERMIVSSIHGNRGSL